MCTALYREVLCVLHCLESAVVRVCTALSRECRGACVCVCVLHCLESAVVRVCVYCTV